MSFTKDQFDTGVWVEFHDTYGGIYQGRVIGEGRRADCMTLVERVIHEPYDMRCQTIAVVLNDEGVLEIGKCGISVPVGTLQMLTDYKKENPYYPWIVKILNIGKSSQPTFSPQVQSDVSDQGRFLSDASRYTNRPNGETGGPSGLNFL
ncbi:hypothetical protein LCGC14_0479350 [marine sediment metagenome]|uniref:Uncharacterized protein n=1 Tax=marine sediment metagenome TaxID=412755 RepID=A0A0F9SF05_9ZZZZ